jgi:hypothetical protein
LYNSDPPAAAFGVALFQSAQGAIAAEKLLLAAGVAHKLIAVPRQLSSSCGFCVRFAWAEHERVSALLAVAKLGLERIVPL